VREQVVKGMTKEHVRKAFGRPPETYPTPQETWVYQTKYYGNLYELTYVYFRDGCVEEVVYRKP
jgi:outer membrane protein assembly factor BamE (lipoprotein component of BamABCDE complex)